MIFDTRTKKIRKANVEKARISFKTVSNHFLCWLALIAYEVYAAFLRTHSLYFISTYIPYYVCNIMIFYTQVWILKETLNEKPYRYVKLIFLIGSQILVFLTMKLIIDYVITDFSLSSDSKYHQLKDMGTLDLLRNIYFTAYGALYWSVSNIGHFRQKAALAEIDRLETERNRAELEVKLAVARNAYLQQQISPHLLLNSLSFIYSTVFKISEEAAESIILLSDIFRFSLEPSDNEGKIKLIDEVEQIENLIKINRQRFGGNLDARFLVEGNLEHHRIIPLIISTLAENVFKHGDLSKHPAIISLKITDGGHLIFETENHKRPIPPYQRLRSNGIENCRIRLDYTYGSNYSLQILNSEDVFSVKLTIDL